MTTIAYRDGVLCGDTAAYNGTTYVGSTRKVVRGPKGQLAGASGEVCWVAKFLRWVEGGEKGDLPAPPDGSRGMIIRPGAPKPTIEIVEDERGPCLVVATFFALGTGATIALGAMAAGSSAWDAVEIAHRLDAYTGGGIDQLEVGAP